MAGGKETPRQKMIGMMYLVLTALLALNVSKDILNAFVTVNQSLEETNLSYSKDLARTYMAFDMIMAKEGDKAKPSYDKAQLAKQYSKDITDYLTSVKNDLYVMGGGGSVTHDGIKYGDIKPEMFDTIKVSSPEFTAKDNYDIPTNYFIAGGRATKLKHMLVDYRGKMATLIGGDSDIGLEILEGEAYRDATGQRVDFEKYYFYNTVLAADVVILNKFLAEAKVVEANVLNKLMQEIGAGDFKFGNIGAKIVANSHIIFKGDPFEAEVFVVAYDTTNNLEVKYRVGVGDLSESGAEGLNPIIGKGGKVSLKVPTGNVGTQSLAGRVYLRNPDGKMESYPFNSSYSVIERAATVSAERMNVMYRGLENPVSVAAGGVPNEKLRVEIDGKVVSPVGGKYSFNPINSGDRVSVNVYLIDGSKSSLLTTQEFRVKNIPNPVAVFANNSSGGEVFKRSFATGAELKAVLRDFLFENVSYKVKSFDVAGTVSGVSDKRSVIGSALSAEAAAFISKLNGSVQFENIKVIGPDGKDRILDAITYKLR